MIFIKNFFFIWLYFFCFISAPVSSASYIDENFEYIISDKSTAGGSSVLIVNNVKSKAIVYREEGIPYFKPCNGASFFQSHVFEKKQMYETTKSRVVVFCASNDDKYTYLMIFKGGKLLDKIQTVEVPVLLKSSDSMYLRVYQRMPLSNGSLGGFYFLFKYDPWSADRFGFLIAHDKFSTEEYKRFYQEINSMLEKNSGKQDFYGEPLLAMLVNVGDAEFICAEINKKLNLFVSYENIQRLISANSNKGYSYFNVSVCNFKKSN